VNDPFGGSLEEDSAAMKSQITYAGTYEFFGDRIEHHVTTLTTHLVPIGPGQRKSGKLRSSISAFG
tara:strand:+ start:108 stop:305 length:198 start_codon:yes stop_codon:yes gene_type:complete